MKPYYDSDGITIYHGDASEIIQALPLGVVVSDPPYNIGYSYKTYDDSLPMPFYLQLLELTFRSPSVMIHYPESIMAFCLHIQNIPNKCVSWVYHANTPRQWRMIAWFECDPDFSKVKQPYRNPEDRRIRDLMEKGSHGASLYDWWEIQQVKNISEEKYNHPCQIPLAVMNNIIGVTSGELIIDPFMGSGTTLVAAKMNFRKAIGIELEEEYCEIAAKRLQQNYFDLRPAL